MVWGEVRGDGDRRGGHPLNKRRGRERAERNQIRKRSKARESVVGVGEGERGGCRVMAFRGCSRYWVIVWCGRGQWGRARVKD